MLFQKLKESGQKPVFMLRHIVSETARQATYGQRDIKSPIAVAQQKQAIKLGLPATTSTDVLPKIKSTRDEQISPTKGNPLAPTARLAEDGQTPQGGVFPELPSPSLREGDATSRSGFSSTGTLTGKEGNTQSVTYAVAIYPCAHSLRNTQPAKCADISQIGRTSSMSLCESPMNVQTDQKWRLICHLVKDEGLVHRPKGSEGTRRHRPGPEPLGLGPSWYVVVLYRAMALSF